MEGERVVAVVSFHVPGLASVMVPSATELLPTTNDNVSREVYWIRAYWENHNDFPVGRKRLPTLVTSGIVMYVYVYHREKKNVHNQHKTSRVNNHTFILFYFYGISLLRYTV